MVVPIPPELSTTCQHRTVDDRVVTQYILWSFHAPTTRCSVGGAAAIQPFRGPAASSKATDAGVMEGPGANGTVFGPPGPTSTRNRSEEHTSELQSRFDIVCRIMLENKNIS